MLELKDTDSSEPEFAVFSRSEPYVIEDDVLDFTNGDAMLLVPDIPASIITVEKPESLIANKIQCGTSIAGVTGTYTADATATATDIASGKTAYIQGQCVIGTGRIGGQGYSYLTITGPNLQLSVTSPQWDGVLEYSLNTSDWYIWDGSLIASADAIYLRGTNNTKITGGSAASYRFNLTSSGKISVLGNIENLLDYDTVANNGHPPMTTEAFRGLFYGCTALIIGPQLRSVNLTESCYYAMFYGCTSLLTAPELPALSLASYCYAWMFSGCTSLEKAPNLPAILLQDHCYQEMFENCSSLFIAPDLPAQILTPYCYYGMFWNCQSLSNIPNISAVQLNTSSCVRMFQGCSNLMLSEVETIKYNHTYRIPMTGTIQEVSGALDNMFQQTGGDFQGTPTVNTTYYWCYRWDDGINPNYLEFQSANDSPISITKSTKTWDGTIQFSTANTNGWIDWNGQTITGTSIKLRGIGNTKLTGGSSTAGFTLTGSVVLNGYLDSLLNYSSLINGTIPSMTSYACANLFKNCTTLLTTPHFIDRTLASYCYYSMFEGCTNLETAYDLSSTELYESCYRRMFYNCTSLRIAPHILAEVYSTYSCYQMFYNCSALTTAYDLSGAILSNYCCGYMFQNCTSLINPPNLLFGTINQQSCSYMFAGCTSLVNMPYLSANTIGSYGYQYMFSGCSNLQHLTDLSALILNTYCYCYMFQNCTQLEELPELAAQVVPNYSYCYMFSGCSKIKLSTTYSESLGYINIFKMPSYGVITSSGSQSYTNMFTGTNGSFKGTPSANTIYYTSNTIVETKAITEIGLHLTSELEIPLYFTLDSGSNLRIDWGDGNQEVTSDSTITNLTHTYTEPGDYVIKLRSTENTVWYAGRYIQDDGAYTLFNKLVESTTSFTKTQITPYVSSLKLGNDIRFYSTNYTSLRGNLSGLVNIEGTLYVPGSVTELSYGTFVNCSKIEKIILGEGLTKINTGNQFRGCQELEEVKLPSVITDLKFTVLSSEAMGCFSETQLNKLQIRAHVTDSSSSSMLWGLAGNNALTEVNIQSKINIYSGMFHNCTNLTSVKLGRKVESIVGSAFNGCTSLQNLDIDFFNPYLSFQAGMIFNKNKTTLMGCLDTVSTFYFPSSLTSIADRAFNNSTNINNFDIPSGITSIGNYAFNNSHFNQITIPTSVTSIGNYAFASANTNSTLILSNLTSLGEYSFSNNTSLQSISFKVSSIPSNAFYNCINLRSASSSVSVSIGSSAFRNCRSLQSYSGTITSIDNSAFQNCDSLTSISLNSTSTIGFNAFSDCTSLTRISCSSSLTNIGSYAFQNCTSLQFITLTSYSTSSTSYSLASDAFNNCNPSLTLQLPSGSYTITSSSTIRSFLSIPQLQNYAFSSGGSTSTNCSIYSGILYSRAGTQLQACPKGRTELVLRTQTTSIHSNAILGGSLTTIQINDSLTGLSQNPFYLCSNLENIITNSTNTYYTAIDGVLYDYNQTILISCPRTKTSINLPNTITTFYDYSCYNTALTSITLPASITTLGNNNYGNNSLTTITCYATTPPTVQSTFLSYVENIYVPAESVETYKAASIWSNYADKISAIVEGE